MLVLPIKSLTTEDKELTGSDIFNLSKLARNDFPVAKGVVVFPLDFNKILQRLQVKNQYDIPLPSELTHELKTVLSTKDIKDIWNQLLDIWLNQLSELHGNATAQTIFFLSKIVTSGVIRIRENTSLKQYVDKSLLHRSYLVDSEIDVSKGELNASQKYQLERMATEMDRLLGIPQTYHFVIDQGKSSKQKIEIVKLTPYIEAIAEKGKLFSPFDLAAEMTEIEVDSKKDDKRTHLKIFVNSMGNLDVSSHLDGVLIDSKNIKNEDKFEALSKTASDFKDQTLIFKLNSLNEDVSILLKCRNKLKLTNIQPVLVAKSVYDFTHLKQELGSLGVFRKASLKLWLEIVAPSSLLQIEEYVEQGLDGVILNLDDLILHLSGAEESSGSSNSQITSLMKFIEEGLRTLHKLTIPVLAMGKITGNDDLIRFLITKGIYGIIINQEASNIFYEDLLWNQKHAHRSLLS